jgi:hypothetical protein
MTLDPLGGTIQNLSEFFTFPQGNLGSSQREIQEKNVTLKNEYPQPNF